MEKNNGERVGVEGKDFGNYAELSGEKAIKAMGIPIPTFISKTKEWVSEATALLETSGIDASIDTSSERSWFSDTESVKTILSNACDFVKEMSSFEMDNKTKLSFKIVLEANASADYVDKVTLGRVSNSGYGGGHFSGTNPVHLGSDEIRVTHSYKKMRDVVGKEKFVMNPRAHVSVNVINEDGIGDTALNFYVLDDSTVYYVDSINNTYKEVNSEYVASLFKKKDRV